jgi:hypothetical protein
MEVRKMAVIKQNKWIWAYAVSLLCYIAGMLGIAANAPYNPFPLMFYMTVISILEQSGIFVALIMLSFKIAGTTTLYLIVRKIISKTPVIRGLVL